MHPIRIQRKRTKGWRMPPNTVYVGRPSKWCNHFVIGPDGTARQCVLKFINHLTVWDHAWVRDQLKGKNLACWCPLDQPCHADVLLKMANA